jgi:hypothetical protein
MPLVLRATRLRLEPLDLLALLVPTTDPDPGPVS